MGHDDDEEDDDNGAKVGFLLPPCTTQALYYTSCSIHSLTAQTTWLIASGNVVVQLGPSLSLNYCRSY